jgi:hypothetical protein
MCQAVEKNLWDMYQIVSICKLLKNRLWQYPPVADVAASDIERRRKKCTAVNPYVEPFHDIPPNFRPKTPVPPPPNTTVTGPPVSGLSRAHVFTHVQIFRRVLIESAFLWTAESGGNHWRMNDKKHDLMNNHLILKQFVGYGLKH